MVEVAKYPGSNRRTPTGWGPRATWTQSHDGPPRGPHDETRAKSCRSQAGTSKHRATASGP